jgi:acyl-CoA hydrolase
VVFVAVGEDGKPVGVPSYVPQTDEERDLDAYAQRFMALRQSVEAERRAFLARFPGA